MKYYIFCTLPQIYGISNQVSEPRNPKRRQPKTRALTDSGSKALVHCNYQRSFKHVMLPISHHYNYKKLKKSENKQKNAICRLLNVMWTVDFSKQ